METITLQRTGRRPVSFTGELLARVETSSEQASGIYSGGVGHSSEVRVYRAEFSGRYVVAVTRYSQWQGELTTHEVELFEDGSELAAWIESSAPLALWARDELIAALDLPAAEL